MAQQTFTGRKRVRKFFGHIKEVAEMPNLIEVQKASYDQFLMVDEPTGGRLDEGLQDRGIQMSQAQAEAIAERLKDQPGALMLILHEVQDRFGYVPREVPVIGQGTWYIDDAHPPTAVAALRRGLDLGRDLGQIGNRLGCVHQCDEIVPRAGLDAAEGH